MAAARAHEDDEANWGSADRLYRNLCLAMDYDDVSQLVVATHRTATLLRYGNVTPGQRRMLVQALGQAGLQLSRDADPTIAHTALRLTLDEIEREGWGRTGTGELEELATRCHDELIGTDWHRRAAIEALDVPPQRAHPYVAWTLYGIGAFLLLLIVVLATRNLFG